MSDLPPLKLPPTDAVKPAPLPLPPPPKAEEPSPEKEKAKEKGKSKIEKQTEKDNTEFANNANTTPPQGLIQKSDWKGVFAAILSFIATVAMSAWNLWSVMYGESRPYLATLSTMTIPAFYWLIKTLTGYDLQANGIKQEVEKANMRKDMNTQLDKYKETLHQKDIDQWMLKVENAKLQEQLSAEREKKKGGI